MPLRTELQKAIKEILEYQNVDGGIPATNPGDNSGAWTTASCLESFLECGYMPIKYFIKIGKMVDYLLDIQLSDGGWPLVDSDSSCTMATGHAISAFILAKDIFDTPLTQKIDLSISRGLKWISMHQNQDGGWGVEPSGGAAGQLTRIAATSYALRPYWIQGVKFSDSSVVRDAIAYFERTQRADGGWAYAEGDMLGDFSDTSNTARALICMIKSGRFSNTSPQALKALSTIKSQKVAGTSWKLGIEGFLLESTPTQNVYHNNGPCDALESLLVAGDYGRETIEGFWWLLSSQRDNGVWHLSSPDQTQRFANVWTWSTSEFIHVINMASEKLLRHMISDRPLDNEKKGFLRRIFGEK